MDGLIFYDMENVRVTADLQLADAAPGSSDDTMLRLLNTNALYQAEDVTVTVAGDDAIQLWLSLDGDNFTSGVDLGDIGPGGGSPTFWLRRVTTGSTSDGDCTARLEAAPAGWTHPLDTSTSVNIPLETGDN